MDDSVAFIYKEYRIEFNGDGIDISGEAYYPGEVLPVGRISGHSYNSRDRKDNSHNKDNSLHIDLLIVSDNHKGKGVGTTLVKMFMLYAEKRKVKHVTTSPTPIGDRTQKELEKFYHKFHFSTGIMIKRIEFVNEDEEIDFTENEENYSNDFEAEKIKNLNHEVEKAVSAQGGSTLMDDEYIEGIHPVEKVELQEDIEAAFRLLNEEEQKIEAKKAMLNQISTVNGLISKDEDDGGTVYKSAEELRKENKALYDTDKKSDSNIDDKPEDDESAKYEPEELESGEEYEEDYYEEAPQPITHIENYKNVGILTTIYYVEEKLPKFSKILDVSSNFIAQKAYFEQKGHQVESIKLLDLCDMDDDSYDVILAIGAMDELEKKESQVAFLKEAYRVCKKNGRIFVSFTSNDMMLANEILNYDADFLNSENVDKKTMKILHGSRTTFKIEEMENIIEVSDMQYYKRFAMDGIAGLMKDQINAMNDRQFNKWMSYHLYACEKEHTIGYSSAIVYILRK